jgi:hypothetical protein
LEMWNDFCESVNNEYSEEEEEHEFTYDSVLDNELEEEPYKIDLNKK